MRPDRPIARLAAPLLAVLLTGLPLAPALGSEEPALGTELRADLLDAVRPIMEWHFGAPIDIVVHRLRVADDHAFVAVHGRRPDGARIDMAQSPMITRDGVDPHVLDGPTLQALMQRSGRMWVAVHHAVGATDVWYAEDVYCGPWRVVIGDDCP